MKTPLAEVIKLLRAKLQNSTQYSTHTDSNFRSEKAGAQSVTARRSPSCHCAQPPPSAAAGLAQHVAGPSRRPNGSELPVDCSTMSLVPLARDRMPPILTSTVGGSICLVIEESARSRFKPVRGLPCRMLPVSGDPHDVEVETVGAKLGLGTSNLIEDRRKR